MLLLVSCATPAHPVRAGDPVPHTTTPTDTAEADDTAETAETADSPAPVEITYTGRFGESPDLVVTGCGSQDQEILSIAEGPDLDGDGLPELAIGSSGADGTFVDEGFVGIFHGGVGEIDLYAPDLTIRPTDPTEEGYFGSSFYWLDRDEDGLDDLFLRSGETRVVRGAELALGVDALATTIPFTSCTPVRWDDVDGDGRADWLCADSGAEPDYTSNAGALWVIPDTAYTIDGIDGSFPYVRGEEDDNLATHGVWPVDLDGDGVREVISSALSGVFVLGSAGVVAGGLARDAILATFAVDAPHVLVLDDLDGGGVPEVALYSDWGGLCVARGEDVTSGATIPAVCDEAAEPTTLRQGEDVDGDGHPDVWMLARQTVSIVSGAALATGTVVTLRTIDGVYDELWAASAGVWLGNDSRTWRTTDVSWHLDAAGDVDLTVRGGGWGGAIVAPEVRDVHHDGAEDLVFWEDARAHIVRGTQLQDGALSLCDGDTVEVDDDDLQFIDDLDGDGIDEALASTRGGTTWSHRVLDGARLLAGEELQTASFDAGSIIPDEPRCLQADGRAMVLARPNGLDIAVYSADLWTLGDAARLGTLIADEVYACAPDLDGDGAEELVVPRDAAVAVVSTAALSPDEVTEPADVVYFEVPDVPVARGVDVWVFPATFGRLAIYTVPAAPVASWTEIQREVWLTSDDYPSAGAVWFDPIRGGADLVMLTERNDQPAFYAVNGEDPSDYDWVLTVGDNDGVGRGPDVLGVGAGSIWRVVQTEDLRGELEVVFARVRDP